MVPGSHFWVARKLLEVGNSGISHQQLNLWAANYVIDLVRCEKLYILDAAASDDARKRVKRTGAEIVEQIVGTAGDIVLMHPWLVHSGTTNLSSRPRILANGMARIKSDIFQRDGAQLLKTTINQCDGEGATKQ